MYQIKMPNLGMTMLEGNVVEWKKEDGATVKEGEDLVEVASETAKLTHVHQARQDGVLKIIVPEGGVITCGGVIGVVE